MTCPTCGAATAPDARFCSQCGGRLAEGMAIDPELRGRVLTSIGAEHRLVTVVFADMTGSVRHTRDLDAEGATALVNPLLETMVELMVQHGGRIDRFLGDGVLAVFGVPAAHEDDPIRAVRAAVGLRERAAELGLSVTAGVNTGRVYFGPVGSSLHEELTVMGPVVNLAARLQGAAAADEVLVGPSTRDHISAWFDLTPKLVEIKGMDHPVTAHTVDRIADDPAKVRGVEGLTSHLIGRDVELERLRSAIDDGTSVAAIVGSAGLGKSRLAREFRELSGRRWIEGRCQTLTADTPFSGFVDAIRREFGGGEASLDRVVDELSALPALSDADVEEIAPYLARLLGAPFGDVRDVPTVETDAAIRRRLTIDAIVRWITAIHHGEPTVVFVDDIHWADPLTIDTLAALARSSTGLLSIASSRPEPGEPLAALRDALDGRTTEIHLTALDSAQTADLVGELLAAGDLPSESESTLIEWAQGNPFYVEELIRSLIARDMLVRRDHRWVPGPVPVTLEIPESVEGLVMSRFDRLSTRDRRAGQLAAVIDRPFSEELLSEVAAEELSAPLQTLTSAEFIRRGDDEFEFAHDLVRQAVYASLLPSQKEELHERVADTIGRLSPDDHESLAFHYDRSANDLMAVEHLHAAALDALDAYANETARSRIDRAMARADRLGAAEHDRWTAACLVLRAQLHERATDHDEAVRDLEVAIDLLDPGDPLVAEVLRLSGRARFRRGDRESAFEAFDAAEALVDPGTDPHTWIGIQADRAEALYFAGRGDELAALIARVEPVVAEYGTAARRADLLRLEALQRFAEHRFVLDEETVSICRDGLAFSEQSADPGRIATSRFQLGFCLIWADQSEDAVPFLEQAVADLRRIGDVLLETRATSYLAIALRRAGRPVEARAAADDALEVAERVGSSYYTGHAKAVRGWADWRLGDRDLAERHLDEAVERWGRIESDGAEGLSTEFAWMAVWPQVAIDVEREAYDEAARRLATLDVPWERPMPHDLAEIVDRARSDPSREVLDRALELAAAHRLL